VIAFIIAALVVWLALAIIGFAIKIALLGLIGIIMFSVTGIALLIKVL
jgi:hypothetical protein